MLYCDIVSVQLVVVVLYCVVASVQLVAVVLVQLEMVSASIAFLWRFFALFKDKYYLPISKVSQVDAVHILTPSLLHPHAAQQEMQMQCKTLQTLVAISAKPTLVAFAAKQAS